MKTHSSFAFGCYWSGRGRVMVMIFLLLVKSLVKDICAPSSIGTFAVGDFRWLLFSHTNPLSFRFPFLNGVVATRPEPLALQKCVTLCISHPQVQNKVLLRVKPRWGDSKVTATTALLLLLCHHFCYHWCCLIFAYLFRRLLLQAKFLSITIKINTDQYSRRRHKVHRFICRQDRLSPNISGLVLLVFSVIIYDNFLLIDWNWWLLDAVRSVRKLITLTPSQPTCIIYHRMKVRFRFREQQVKHIGVISIVKLQPI